MAAQERTARAAWARAQLWAGGVHGAGDKGWGLARLGLGGGLAWPGAEGDAWRMVKAGSGQSRARQEEARRKKE